MQERYKNEGFNHAYAFGGRTHISHATPKQSRAWKDEPTWATPRKSTPKQKRVTSLAAEKAIKSTKPIRLLPDQLAGSPKTFMGSINRITWFTDNLRH